VPVVRTQVSSRLIPVALENPFPLYIEWPCDNESLEVIELDAYLSELPHAVPQLGVEDGLVVMMKEAWRCLVPGGIMHIRVAYAANPVCIANPMSQRYFNRGTFVHFSRPHEESEEEWDWAKYGPDYGMRFVMTSATDENGYHLISLEKPND
jgi:hypothetical protein